MRDLYTVIADRGRGVKNPENYADGICTWPLMEGQGARQAPSPCSFQCSFTFFHPPSLSSFLPPHSRRNATGEALEATFPKQLFRGRLAILALAAERQPLPQHPDIVLAKHNFTRGMIDHCLSKRRLVEKTFSCTLS